MLLSRLAARNVGSIDATWLVGGGGRVLVGGRALVVVEVFVVLCVVARVGGATDRVLDHSGASGGKHEPASGEANEAALDLRERGRLFMHCGAGSASRAELSWLEQR